MPMPRWTFGWTDALKKKLCRFLLQRYLGQFMNEKLTLDQLTIDLYKGTGTVYNVTLYTQALNELFEDQGWDLEVTSGRIGRIDVSVPWNAMMSKDSRCDVDGLFLSMRPLARDTDDGGASMFESMWSSISSAMQLAQDCLEKEEIPPNSVQSSPMEGLERFAEIIDNILNRVTVRLSNTTIRLEQRIPGTDQGIAIIVTVDKLDYKNEAGGDPSDNPANARGGDYDDYEPKAAYSISNYATHHIVIEGVSFYTEEFRIVDGQEMVLPKIFESMGMAEEQFHSTMTELPEVDTSSRAPRIEDDVSDSESDGSETDRSEDDGAPKIYSSEKVIFGQWTGKQEIRIKLKQSESIQGPKVQLEMTMGSLNLFVTPRQLSFIHKFHEVFLLDDPPAPDRSALSAIHRSENIRRYNPDGSRASSVSGDQSEIRNNMQRRQGAMSGGLSSNQGWSTDQNYDNSSQQYTLYTNPISNRYSQSSRMSESVYSTNTSMTSSMCSSASQSTHATSRGRRRGIIDADPNADISHLNVRIGCVALVLLHEDILIESVQDYPLSEESVSRLNDLAAKYFETVSSLNVRLGHSDMQAVGEVMRAACEQNHIRIFVTPIIVEGEEQRNTIGNLLRLTVSIANADFREILKNGLQTPLVEFPNQDSSSGPNIRMSVKQTSHILRGHDRTRFAPPKTEISLTLAPCVTEIDLSMLDRLTAILNTDPFASDDQSSDQKKRPEKASSRVELKVECPSVDASLRFPIADLRPLNDPQRIKWWEKNVRADYLMFTLTDMTLIYSLPTTIDIIAHEVDAYYYETAKTERINVAKAADMPRITIQIPLSSDIEPFGSDTTQQQSASARSKSSNLRKDGSHFMESIMAYTAAKVFTPFSAKRILRQSDTPHKTGPTSGDGSKPSSAGDSDMDTLLPGDNAEMKAFCDSATKASRIQVKVTVPVVSLQLRSKQLLEILYNRINSDLLLWEPKHTAPEPASFNPLLNVGMMDSMYAPYSMAKSGIHYDSNSESEADPTESMFFSMYDKSLQAKPKSSKLDRTCAMAFKLSIGQGTMTMYTPVRDSLNHVIPGQLGEFIMKLSSTELFSVNGYNGDSDLGYVCLQSGSVEIYHCGLIPVPSPNPPLRLIGSVLPAHSLSTLYPTPRHISLIEPATGARKREMVSLAIEVQKKTDQKVKKIKMAIGLEHTTLRHNTSMPEHTWLTQLIDLFDVKDSEIEGYIPLDVVTEMHLHIWDSAIDYRPRFFAFRSIVTIGSFSLSSNISTVSSGCTLRFIAEDCTMSLAPQIPTAEAPSAKKSLSHNKISALPGAELVCVVDLGLFEISLRLNDKATSFSPKFDMRATVNDLHLRTCSDSAGALAQLIAYLATDGDLIDPDHEDDDSASDVSSSKNPLVSTSPMGASSPEVSEMQQQHVNRMMEEAMKESIFVPSKGASVTASNSDEDVFYFPDQKRERPFKVRSKSTCEPMRSLDEYQIPSTTFSSLPVHAEDADTVSVNTETRDLLNFECSMMPGNSSINLTDSDCFEPFPQVAHELGNISNKKNPPPVKPKEPTRRVSSDTDDEFCIIGDEERPRVGFESVFTSDDPIRIVDNHFSVPAGKADLLQAPKDFPMAVIRYTLCEMTFTWHLYGGQDFPTKVIDPKARYTAKNATATVSTSSSSSSLNSSSSPGSLHRMSDTYRMGVSYSKGSPNVTIGGPTQNRRQAWKQRGGAHRRCDILMEILIQKMRFSHEIYPSTMLQASRQVLLIRSIEVRDRLACSKIKKFLYLNDDALNTGSQHMVVIKMLHLRPEPTIPAQECCLCVSLRSPIRVNIDQDALLFLIEFFNNMSNCDPGCGSSASGTAASSSGAAASGRRSSSASGSHQEPVMMVDLPDIQKELQARRIVSENLDLLIDESRPEEEEESDYVPNSDDSPIYFRNIVFSPAVVITVDYHGKRVEMSNGPLTGLIMGIGHLKGTSIRLKEIRYRKGVLGVDRLLRFLMSAWSEDIKSNQVSSLLRGVGPMNVIVQLLQGILDLFWLPIEQYRKDGRIVRGLQLGAQSFTTRTMLAVLEITTRVIDLLQITAETAYDIVSPGPSVRRLPGLRRGKRKRLMPPQDIREGVTNALTIVREGFGDTAHTICEMTALEHDQKGYTGAVGAVLRQIPPTVVRPLVLATQATSNVLGGVCNQLVPDARREAKAKWKDDDDDDEI